MTQTDNPNLVELAGRRRSPWPTNCGPYCRGFDLISGTCSHHWTAQDQIVERVTSGFKRDLAAIILSEA